ncbi:MAG: MATE family efflux transporter [Erysipelotrichales bacterium]|nr:MATE family efflux transporter [Erysipelotrichales bacterium]
MSQANTQLFEKTSIPKAIMQLSLPTIIGSLVTVVYSLADTFFVGLLNDPIQTAAVTLAGTVLLAFNAINNLFGVGSSSMMSRALGTKEYDTVRKTSAFGFYASLISGIIFSILCTVFKTPLLNLLGADASTAAATSGYMFWTVTCGAAPAILNVVLGYMVRSEGASLHASIGTMSGCLLNIILDPIFILPFGFNMGAAGAGLATFISNCVACIYFFILLAIKKDKTFVCVNPKMFGFSRRIVTGVCTVGIPASIQNLLNVTSMTILNNFASSYGADAVAAIGIAQKLNMIPLQVALGFSQGVMPLISYTYASHNYKRMKAAIMFAIKLVIPALLIVSCVYYFGSNVLVGSFIDNPNVVGYGATFLRAYCLAIPFLSFDFLTVGIFQAHGNGKAAFVFAILRKIILEIPALIVLNKLFPLYGLPYAQVFTEVILATAAAFMLRNIFKECQE